MSSITCLVLSPPGPSGQCVEARLNVSRGHSCQNERVCRDNRRRSRLGASEKRRAVEVIIMYVCSGERCFTDRHNTVARTVRFSPVFVVGIKARFAAINNNYFLDLSILSFPHQWQCHTAMLPAGSHPRHTSPSRTAQSARLHGLLSTGISGGCTINRELSGYITPV